MINQYKLSRYWNRLAFWVIRLGIKMIWDQTGMNADLIKDIGDGSAEEILTQFPNNCILRKSPKESVEDLIRSIDVDQLHKRINNGDNSAKALSNMMLLVRIEPNNHNYRSKLRTAIINYSGVS